MSWPLVDASYPGNGYLYLKLTYLLPGVVVGSLMPPVGADGGPAPLDTELAQWIYDWSAAGAPND